MYCQHFGLRETPFSLTPDTGYFFNRGSHQEALNTLLVALKSGEGFIKITGEVGTGKTLLCRQLLKQLPAEEFVTAYLPNPTISAAGLNRALADELTVKYPRNQGQHCLLKRLNEALIEFSAAGKQVILIIDEAQAMHDDTLESLRLLTNLETEKRKLLQIVLFGQPELNDRLDSHHLRQLKQRITFSHHLRPMNLDETQAYIQHRLTIAGSMGQLIFPTMAIRRIFQNSHGIPRLINILAHKAMLAAYGQGQRRIDGGHVALACQDGRVGGKRSDDPDQRLVATGLAACALIIVALAINSVALS